MLSIQDIPHRWSQMQENGQPKRYVNQSQMSHPQTNYCIDNAKARLRILQKIAFFKKRANRRLDVFKCPGHFTAAIYRHKLPKILSHMLSKQSLSNSAPHNLRSRGNLVCQKHLGLFSVQILSCRLSLKVFFFWRTF